MFGAIFTRCDLFPLSKGFDKVAAVGKAGFLADFREGRICKTKQFLPFFNANEFYIIFAGAAIEFFEAFGEMGITHMAHICKFFYFKRFVRMKTYLGP